MQCRLSKLIRNTKTTGANFLEKEELEAMKYLNSIKEKAATEGHSL